MLGDDSQGHPSCDMHPLQDEEKQQFAAASLQYNLQHAQLKAMFQKELQAAISGSSSTADESSADCTAQSTAGSTAQTADQTQSSGQSETMLQQQSPADAADEAPTSRVAAMALNDPTVPKHASPQEHQSSSHELQSDFLDRMYKLMLDGQPEYALENMEVELK